MGRISDLEGPIDLRRGPPLDCVSLLSTWQGQQGVMPDPWSGSLGTCYYAACGRFASGVLLGRRHRAYLGGAVAAGLARSRARSLLDCRSWTWHTVGMPPPTMIPSATVDPVHELLASPLLDPAVRLKAVLGQLERYKEEWEEAQAECDDISDPEKVRDARAGVRAAFQRFSALQIEARKIEDEVRRRALELPRAGKWAEEYTALLVDLKAQYTGLGPHYEVLCEHVSSITIRLRMMEGSGRDVASGEYIEMYKIHASLVNQLQKYTEAMKSETISKEAKMVAENIIAIAERHFGNNFPSQWSEFVKDIRAAVDDSPAAA